MSNELQKIIDRLVEVGQPDLAKQLKQALAELDAKPEETELAKWLRGLTKCFSYLSDNDNKILLQIADRLDFLEAELKKTRGEE